MQGGHADEQIFGPRTCSDSGRLAEDLAMGTRQEQPAESYGTRVFHAASLVAALRLAALLAAADGPSPPPS